MPTPMPIPTPMPTPEKNEFSSSKQNSEEKSFIERERIESEVSEKVNDASARKLFASVASVSDEIRSSAFLDSVGKKNLFCCTACNSSALDGFDKLIKLCTAHFFSLTSALSINTAVS